MEAYKTIDNPYTMQFGLIPKKQYIKRQLITDEIILNFQRNVPTYRGIFITGVRGCGKTVLMGKIRDAIAETKDEKGQKKWIAVTLEPDGNLLDSLTRALYRIPQLKTLFVEAEIDFSILGIGFKIKNAKLVATDEKDALFFMLDVLKRLGIKLLVCIDEVTNTKDIAAFSHVMASLANQDYDIFALMTGLTRNIEDIKNKSDLTFLYRAKQYNLEILNVTYIRDDYKATLGLAHEDADELARMTKGYSFAYQAFGFYYWEELSRVKNRESVKLENVIRNVESTLFDMAYDKIWSEQSGRSREILIAMQRLQSALGKEILKVADIRQEVDMTSGNFTQYRDKLVNDSILRSDEYGYLSFNLPRFGEYAKTKMYERM